MATKPAVVFVKHGKVNYLASLLQKNEADNTATIRWDWDTIGKPVVVPLDSVEFISNERRCRRSTRFSAQKNLRKAENIEFYENKPGISVKRPKKNVSYEKDDDGGDILPSRTLNEKGSITCIFKYSDIKCNLNKEKHEDETVRSLDEKSRFCPDEQKSSKITTNEKKEPNISTSITSSSENQSHLSVEESNSNGEKIDTFQTSKISDDKTPLYPKIAFLEDDEQTQHLQNIQEYNFIVKNVDECPSWNVHKIDNEGRKEMERDVKCKNIPKKSDEATTIDKDLKESSCNGEVGNRKRKHSCDIGVLCSDDNVGFGNYKFVFSIDHLLV